MKTLLSLALAALLCACAATPTMSTSLDGLHDTSAPTDKNDPRLAQPKFYRDDGDGAWWTHASNPGIAP